MLTYSGLIINCCLHIEHQRTENAIYHLLNGKRSIQTVQDAHLFGLDRFYGVLPSLTIDDFKYAVDQCVKQGFLIRSIADDQTYIHTTSLGKHALHNNPFPYHYLNGLRYFDIDDIFLERLILLVQVLTNSHMNNSSYIPVIDKPVITNWIKRVYPHFKPDVHTYLQQLYDDLYGLLSRLSEEEAHMFVDRLTGYEHYGLSTHQLARKYHMKTDNIPLYLRAITHRLLTLINTEEVETNIVFFITKDLPKLNFMTKSAQETYKLIQKQFQAEDIAHIRRLKLNTIYDHIVEIAWYDPNFHVHTYINQQQIDRVKDVVKNTQSLQLRTIKDHVGDQLTYFQIRLALTRINNVFTKGVLQYEQ